MSMLSIEDIKEEMGNIKDNSINLTASKFAWSVKSKESIYNEEENVIKIEPGDTTLVYSREAIYVSNMGVHITRKSL